jgi:hypothetical protein
VVEQNLRRVKEVVIFLRRRGDLKSERGYLSGKTERNFLFEITEGTI